MLKEPQDPAHLPRCSVLRSYLVGVVEEVHGHAERQGVVIGVPEQDGEDLHTGRPGLPLSLLLRSLHRALAVDGVLPHLSPGHGTRAGTFEFGYKCSFNRRHPSTNVDVCICIMSIMKPCLHDTIFLVQSGSRWFGSFSPSREKKGPPPPLLSG